MSPATGRDTEVGSQTRSRDPFPKYLPLARPCLEFDQRPITSPTGGAPCREHTRQRCAPGYWKYHRYLPSQSQTLVSLQPRQLILLAFLRLGDVMCPIEFLGSIPARKNRNVAVQPRHCVPVT